jgi:hypothetical protein
MAFIIFMRIRQRQIGRFEANMDRRSDPTTPDWVNIVDVIFHVILRNMIYLCWE